MPEFLQEVEDWQLLRRLLFGQRPQYALRSPGRARRIEHRGTDPLVRNRCLGQPAGGFAQADDVFAAALAIDDDTELDLGTLLEGLASDLKLCQLMG